MGDSLSSCNRKYVERLYDEYKNVMYRTAFYIVKDSAQAEDIVQFAFIRIIRHIEKISRLPGEEVKGYIVLIIKHLSFDSLRRRKQENIVPIELMEPAEEETSVEDVAINNFEISRMRRSLESMEEKYSLPLVLKYSLGFSHSEISEMLGISVENVKVRCHRGKRMLMEAIRREAVE